MGIPDSSSFEDALLAKYAGFEALINVWIYTLRFGPGEGRYLFRERERLLHCRSTGPGPRHHRNDAVERLRAIDIGKHGFR
jgi:hypothetical protein